jgi:NTE family protein
MPFKGGVSVKGYGLVLSGGGAKGGYEIGVWKALRELQIPISAVAGTSVGAINGAVIVQEDYEKAYDLWTSLSIENVIKVEREVAAFEEENKKKHKDIFALIKNAIISGGLDITPLKEMLTEIIDEKKIRESDVDFAIVTFSLTDFKPVTLYKNDIPEGKLVEYILASACFPAFKRQEIDNKLFIDGGVYNNMPVSLLIDKGIKKIIAVDVMGPGVVRKADTKGIDITYIKCSEYLGATLNFNGEKAKEQIDLGYLDTMKAFGKLNGCKYFLEPGEDIGKLKNEYIDNIGVDDFKKLYSYLGIHWTSKSSSSNKILMDMILRTIQQYTNGKLNSDTVLPAMAEIAAEQLKINRKRVYTLVELTEEIIKEYERIKSSSEYEINAKAFLRLIPSRSQVEFDRELKIASIEERFLISYNANISEMDDKVKRYRRFLAMAFPKICIANLYIALILSRK